MKVFAGSHSSYMLVVTVELGIMSKGLVSLYINERNRQNIRWVEADSICYVKSSRFGSVAKYRQALFLAKLSSQRSSGSMTCLGMANVYIL